MGAYWTEDEDEQIERYFSRVGAKRLSLVLPGRTVYAVNSRRWILANRASKRRLGVEIENPMYEFGYPSAEWQARWREFNRASIARIEART